MIVRLLSLTGLFCFAAMTDKVSPRLRGVHYFSSASAGWELRKTTTEFPAINIARLATDR